MTFVSPEGFEPPTMRLRVSSSTRLSYGPKDLREEIVANREGFEPSEGVARRGKNPLH